MAFKPEYLTGDRQAIERFIDKFDVFLFDCDGWFPRQCRMTYTEAMDPHRRVVVRRPAVSEDSGDAGNVTRKRYNMYERIAL